MPLCPALLAVLIGIALNGAFVAPALAVSEEDALGIALENARVPRVDAHNIRIQADEEGGEPVWSVEFDTHYGNYDFSVSRGNGRIRVGAEQALAACDKVHGTRDCARQGPGRKGLGHPCCPGRREL